MAGRVKLLPHHMGIYTDFYFSDYRGKEGLLGMMGHGHSAFSIQNDRKLFYTILLIPDTNVEITLLMPDSICQPATDPKCRENCLEHKRFGDDISKKMLTNPKYSSFRRACTAYKEISILLHYELEPAVGYSSRQFNSEVEKTGKKVGDLIRANYKKKMRGDSPESLISKFGLEPDTLGYLFLGTEKEYAEAFPMAAKLRTSELYIFNELPAWEEIRAGRRIKDSTIDLIEKRFPFMFLESQKAMFEGMKKAILSKPQSKKEALEVKWGPDHFEM